MPMSLLQNKSLILRELKSADAVWMANLHHECFEAPQRWHADSMRSLVTQKTNTAVALIVDYKPVGFIIASHVADEGEILTLAIAPQERRKGYARLLVETFVDEEKHRGLEKVFLEVIETNTSAIHLYDSLGFEVVTKRPDYYLMPPGAPRNRMDGFLMVKHLSVQLSTPFQNRVQHLHKPN